MGSYKHIEHAVGNYIAFHYTRAIEAGIGNNPDAALLLDGRGALVRCTDIRNPDLPKNLPFSKDDIFEPCLSLYEGADVIYAIRPAVEMMPALISIARAVNSDLIVVHLGFEIYENGGERIRSDGVVLHRYVKRSEPVEQR